MTIGADALMAGAATIGASQGSQGPSTPGPVAPHLQENPQAAAPAPQAPVFLENVTQNDQVVGDLQLVFAAQGAKYDHFIRPVSQFQFQNSMGIQVLVARGILKEIPREEAVLKLAKQSGRLAELHGSNGDASIIEELTTEIGTEKYESAALESFKKEYDSLKGSDDQKAPDLDPQAFQNTGTQIR
jgi:hypothetical protein